MALVLYTGTYTGSTSSSTILNDENADFTGLTLNSSVVITNLTDSSTSIWESIVSNTFIQHSALSGGVLNLWTNGDIYTIAVGSPESVTSSSIFIRYNLGQNIGFSTRIITAGRNARYRYYETQRRGPVALYKNAYNMPPEHIDQYHGNADLETEPFIFKKDQLGISNDYYDEATLARNLKVLYGPTSKTRLLYVRPTEQTLQGPWGVVARGNVSIIAPLTRPFRRYDVIKIHDKIWMIADIPQFEYWQDREIIGYRFDCVSLKHQQMNW